MPPKWPKWIVIIKPGHCVALWVTDINTNHFPRQATVENCHITPKQNAYVALYQKLVNAQAQTCVRVSVYTYGKRNAGNNPSGQQQVNCVNYALVGYGVASWLDESYHLITTLHRGLCFVLFWGFFSFRLAFILKQLPSISNEKSL